MKRRNMSALPITTSPSDFRRALWKALRGALIGAIVVTGVMIAFTYGRLDFGALPRTSAATFLLGVVAFIYATSRLGEAIALLGDLRSARAQQAVQPIARNR